MTGRRKVQTETERLVAILEARRAARVAAGDPWAIRVQAAVDRARAEHREDERRERDRLLRLLKGGTPGRPKQPPLQQRLAAEQLIADVLAMKRTTLEQAFRDYGKIAGIEPDSVKRKYRAALATTNRRACDL
jgi:hypothetical protein